MKLNFNSKGNQSAARLIIACLLFFSFASTSSAQVNLTATAGTLSASYGTLGAAFTAINNGVHQGTITISIVASISEGTTPATLNSSGAGSASYASVLIQPGVDGVTVSGNPVTGFGVIQLNGADNITIDGDNPNSGGTNRNLTVSNTTTATVIANSTIRIATSVAVTSADNNTIRNCVLSGNVTGGNLSTITSATGSSNSSFGIYVGGNGGGTSTSAPTAITSVTTNTAPAGTTINSLLIDNNAISQCARAIVFNGAATSVSTGVTITNNLVGDQGTVSGIPPYSSPASTVYTKGIWVNGTNAVTISGNTLNNIMSYVATTITTIELAGAIGTGTISITGNVITNPTQNGSGSSTVKAILISASSGAYTVGGNIISNIQSMANAQGTDAVEVTVGSGTIEKNKITTVYNRFAGNLGVYAINLAGGSNTTVRNNFISDVKMDMSFAFSANFGTSTGIHAIRVASGTGHKVYHNSVSLFGTLFGTANLNILTSALTITTTSNTGVDVRNNIFSNTLTGGPAGSAHVSIFLPSGATATLNLTLNNNAYYCGGSTSQGIAQAGTTSGTNFYLPGNFNSGTTTPSTNLRAYTSTLSAGGTNDNATFVSTSAAPFTSSSDLHIPAATSTQLESAGATTTVITDIDGDARPGPVGSINGGASAPDIGADEFDGFLVDLSAPVISYTALTGTCNTTDRTLTATITDASGVPVSGTLRPRIYYKKNAGAYFSSTGVLATGSGTNGTWTFTITVADMGGVVIGDVISYFVIAQDIAGTPNISSSPSGVIASDVNTVSTPPASPASYLIQTTLNGSYSVGVGQTYTTLTAAVISYNNSCLSGPVTFVLTDASYPSETFPIVVNANSFSSPVNTLTIVPNTGVAVNITGSSTTAIIKLYGADYVTINGLNSGGSSLSLSNSDAVTTLPAVFWIASPSVSDGATHNTISNCNISGNAANTYGVIDGSSISPISQFNSAESPNSFLTVQSCAFTRLKAGIYVNGNASSLDANNLFTSNTFGSAVSADKLSATGILVQNVQGATISSNIINGIISGNTTAALGIGVFGNIATVDIFNNRISDIKNTNTGAPQGCQGIHLSASTAASNVKVYNNFIWDLASFGQSGFGATANAWGILLSAGGGYNIYYNSVLMGTNQTSAASTTAALNIISGVTSINVQNNILANTQTVGTSRYSIVCGAAASIFTAINYNDYYVPGNLVGRISNTDQATLSAWIGAVGQDANSLSVDPSFVSTTNLHLVTSSSPLDNSGVSIAGITTDIDGDVRPATPDMGADEFTFANNNCTGTPTAGTIPSSLTLCPAQSTTLNLSGYTQGVLGITFQWEESDDNGVNDPWANAVGGSGSTTITYVTPGSLNTIYYRCKVTCSFTSLFAYSNVCTISITPFTLPEDFSSVTFPATCWSNNNPTYLFRSGVSAFGVGSGSAEYNFYSATYLANLDLTTPVFAPYPAGYVLTFAHAYATSNALSIDELDILYSTNGGGSYTLLTSYAGGVSGPLNTGGLTGSTTQFVPTAGQWANKLVALPAGTNRLIFRGIGQFGNNLYIDNINILPPGSCDTPVPSASNVTPTTADISWTCAGCTGSYDLDYGAAAHVAGSGTIVTGVTSTYTLNPPLTPNASYTVYVRQNCGVYGFGNWSAAVNFTTPCASPVPVASTNTPLCDGGDITLMAVNNAVGQTSGNTYSWTGPGGFSSAQQDTTITSGSSADNGNYTVTITNQYGCTASGSVNVVVNPNPTVAPSSNAPFCSLSQNLNLSSNSPTATLYSWTGPGGFSSSAINPTISNAPDAASGIYKVVATDANGCKDSATTSVTIYALPPVGITVIGGTNLCTGQTSSDLQATGAGATGTYSWSTGETTDLITVNTAGTYTVTGTDNHTCVNTFQVVITASPAPAAPIVTPAGPINLCSSDGGFTYTSATLCVSNYSSNLSWSTGETSTCITVDYGDIFNVTYTDPSGCIAVSNAVVTNAYLASTDPTGASSNAFNNNICLGNNITLSVVGGSLGDGADWHWYESTCGGTARGTGASVTLTPSTAGLHHYFVRAEGPCNPTGTACAPIDVTVSTAPPSGTSHFTASTGSGCNGSSFVFSTNAVTGASYYSWSGTSGALFNGNPGPVQTTTPSVTVTFATAPPGGTSGYNICSFAGNACGQSNTICTWVRAKVTQPGTISGSIIACTGTNGTYSIAPIAGADTYTWTITGNATINGGGTTLTTASASITANFLGGWTSGTLSVYASMNCGFNSAVRNLALTNTPAVPGTMAGPSYVCPGNSATFSVPAVAGASGYNWTCSIAGAVLTPSANSCSILFPAVIPGGSTVCVAAVSPCGGASATRCKGIANGTPGTPTAISGPTTGQCSQSGVSYSITPVFQATGYSWTANNGATISGPSNLSGVSINFPSAFTTCTLSVVALNNCGTSLTRTLVVNGTPAQPGVISGNQSVCIGAVETYSTTGSSGATSYNWTVPSGSSILGPANGSSILVLWGSTGGNVSVTASNGCGTSTARNLAVAVTCRSSQVENTYDELLSEVYPNPVNDHAQVKFNSNIQASYSLIITDVLGHELLSKEGKSSEGINIIDLDLAGYAKGFYMMRLTLGNKNSQVHFTVQ